MTTHILIVEDEPAIQELLVFNLELAGYQVWRAENVKQAWQHIQQQIPQLILLDWMLPDCSGVTLAKQLRADARTCNLPIIMLTARGDERDKIMGLESGADDYITKPFSPRELMARIKAVLRRLAPAPQDEVLNLAGLELSSVTQRVCAKGQELDMGPTELRLLQFFMTHPNRVFSRNQLLDQVWGTQNFVEERTVDVHVRRVRAALESVQLDHLIQTVRGSGYLFKA